MIKRTPNGLYVSDDLTVDMSRVKPELKKKFIRQVQDFNEGGRLGVAPKLVVAVAATHAGLPTGNMAFYTPDRMKSGLPSFTDGYPKPVLLHHNDSADPVGRVHRATYRDLSHKYLEPMSQFKERYGGITFCDAVQDLEKAFDQVNWIMENMVPMKDYVGLGYGELDLHITDAIAAEKIVDQRYLTVSVGFTTDSMYCSNCHQDWAAEGFCEHERGKVYDGKKTLLIPGKFQYEEVSWVNSPADGQAQVLSLTETPSLAGELPEVLETLRNTQDTICDPILFSVWDGKVSRLDSFKKVAPARAQEVISVAKQNDNTQQEVPELIKAVTDDVEVEDTVVAADLPADAKQDNEEAEKSEMKDQNINDNQEVPEETQVVDVVVESKDSGHMSADEDEDDTPKKKKKRKAKKMSDDIEGEDVIELEDDQEVPEGYELMEDSVEVEDTKEVDPRTAIENDPDLTDAQKARKLFELSRQSDDSAPVEFEVVEVELVDPTNEDAKIKLAFTSEDSFTESLAQMTQEAVEANRVQLEDACKVFGTKLPTFEVEDGGYAEGTPLTKAQTQAQAEALFLDNVNKLFIDKLIDAMNTNINSDDARKELGNYIIDKLIEGAIVDNIFADFNALQQELQDTREKLARITKSNRDFYASKQDDLARVVVALKVALKKPEFVDLNDEALVAKTKELKVRSVDSLEDSLSDLINEFSDNNQVETENTDEVSVTPVEPEIGRVVQQDSKNRHDMEIFEGLNDAQYRVALKLQNRFKNRSK